MTGDEELWPSDKIFEKVPPGSVFLEIGFLLIADWETDQPQVIGTAVALSPYLLITARHVLEEIFPTHSGARAERVDRTLVALQTVHEPQLDYLIWSVRRIISHPATDLALLYLASEPERGYSFPIRWNILPVDPFPPPTGRRVAAFGFRLGRVEVTHLPSGGRHLNCFEEGILSSGAVRETFQYRRDKNLNFPCYQVSARFDGGMSGGPVYDEAGALCGIVCSSFDGAHAEGEPISYVSSLWPVFGMLVDFKRANDQAPGAKYPLIELARDKIIRVVDLPRLEAVLKTVA